MASSYSSSSSTHPTLSPLVISPGPDGQPAFPIPSHTRSNSSLNVFAQWSPPSSPVMTQRDFDSFDSDIESDAGYESETLGGKGLGGHDSDASDSSAISGARTPNGHPVKGHRGHKSIARGLGFGRFGLGPKGFTKGAEQSFSETLEKEKRRRESVFAVNTKRRLSWPRLRVPRRARPAFFGLLFALFLLLCYQTSFGPRSPSAIQARSARRGTHLYQATGGFVHTTRGPPSTMQQHSKKQRPKGGAAPTPRTQIKASPSATDWNWKNEQLEFAALMTFINAAPANTVPVSVDPSRELDPELILDFDPSTPRAEEELKEIHDSFWQEHPVLVLSKTRNAHSRFIRSTLYQLNIQPSPLVLDINERSDVDILLPIFHRLIGQSDLPILIIGGEVVGGWYEIDVLIKNEWLKPLIASHGGRFAPKKKKKKAGHGGKTEEQILAAIEAEKLADEAKRLEKIEAELAKAHAFEQEEVRRELQAKAEEEAAQRKADVVLQEV